MTESHKSEGKGPPHLHAQSPRPSAGVPAACQAQGGGSHGRDAHLLETFVSGQELVRGRLLRVVRDIVELPGGGHTEREYITHPGAVMIVPILGPMPGVLSTDKSDGAQGVEVILERQFRYPIGRVVIEFPAGKLDPGEHGFDCAQRELLEETGYSASHWAYCGSLHPTVAYSTEELGIWFARGLTPGQRRLDEGENLDVVTATEGQVLNWCRNGTITDAKTLVAALWLDQWLTGRWPLEWRLARDWRKVAP